jgi:hypothetical protein
MKYSLIGQDGNAFALMGYTGRALRETGHRDLVSQMQKEAMSGDYYNLIRVCDKYLDICNEGLEDDEDEDFEWLFNSIDWNSDSIVDDEED